MDMLRFIPITSIKEEAVWPDSEYRWHWESSGHHRLVKPPTGETQTSLNIFEFQIGKFCQGFLKCKAISKEIKNIGHADAHPTNTGPTAALLRVNSNAFC
jgi:hypothetical protein